MKKLILTLLFTITLTLIKGQDCETWLKPLFVYNDSVINDTNTHVYIRCVTDSIKFRATGSNLSINLHKDKEYYITFVRQGFETKVIYVSTIDCLRGQYTINCKITLKKGDHHNAYKSGVIFYDNISKQYYQKKIPKTPVRVNYLYYYFKP